jgi:hypothetical protein
MKRLLAMLILSAMAISFVGCGPQSVNDSTSNVETTIETTISPYANDEYYDKFISKFTIYADLSEAEADAAYSVLKECGLTDKRPGIVLKKDGYFKFYIGINDYDLYFDDDNVLCKIEDNGIVIYQDGKVVETTTEPTTEEPTTVEPTTKEPATEKITKAVADIIVTSVTSNVDPGQTASVSIQGSPNTDYSISVRYKSGNSTAAGLKTKMSDSNGNVSWSWEVGAKTSSGTYPITISGGGTSTSTEFTVN